MNKPSLTKLIEMLITVIFVAAFLLTAPAQSKGPTSYEKALMKFVIEANKLYLNGKIQEAAKKYQGLTRLKQSQYHDNIYYGLGKCYVLLGDHNKAHKTFLTIATKYERGDVVKKGQLAIELLSIIEDNTILEPVINWKRFIKGYNSRGKPNWDINKPADLPIDFRAVFKYFQILEKLDPFSEETLRAKDILTQFLNQPIRLKVLDHKGTSREGLHPNNWRTVLTRDESILFSNYLSLELFKDWKTPYLNKVVRFYNNVVNGKDHWEAKGTFTLRELFDAANYKPESDTFLGD